MRRLSLWLAVPVACAFACGDATQPAPPPPHLISFDVMSPGDVPEGPPWKTECVIGTQNWVNYVAEPHFVQNPYLGGAQLPYTTFTDAVQPPNQCGNLSFDGRSRTITSYYATEPTNPDESPWKYWWRRSRRVGDGEGVLDPLDKVYREAGVFGQETVPALLSQEYHAIGVILVLNQSPDLVINHEVFIDPTFTAYGNINLAVQHWDSIPAPTQLTATRQGSSVTLTWHNEHAGGSLDSTNIYREGTFRRTVGPADTSFVESNLAPGSYRYTVKHLSAPAVRTNWFETPYPNSPSSNDAWVTIPEPEQPEPPAVTISGPTYMSQPGNYTWTTSVTPGTPPYTYQWWYRLMAGGAWQKLNGQTNPSYTRYVGYSQWAFRLRADVTDAMGLVGSGSIAVDVPWGARPVTEPPGR